jgi:FkbM family methyltransferase
MNAPPSCPHEAASDGGRWTMRSVAKASLIGAASRLPAAVRKTLLRGLASASADYETLQLLGRRHGVKDLRVAGDYGLIEGSINDSVVLRSYAVTKTWDDRGNRQFVEFFDRHHGGTYIDIGANIGLTTIPIARNAAVSCKAFEPEPACFRYLRSNLAANCLHGNVDIFNLALFDKAGVLEFELSDRNLGDHRIHVRNEDGFWGERQRPIIRVEANRLDDVLTASALAGPVAAKVVTQGSESHIFAGGDAVLGIAELVTFEFWPYGIARAGGDVGLLTAFIGAHFRSGAIVTGDGDEPLTWRPIDAVVDVMTATADRRDHSPYEYHEVFVRK